MSYTKQTWETGDIITSEKLNHIEDGVAEGCGGEIAFVTLNFTGFQTSHACGNICYFKKIDNAWKSVSLQDDSWFKIGSLTIVEEIVIPPEDSGIVVAWCEGESFFTGVDVSVSGGISSDTFRGNYQNSSTGLTCYPITGSGTIDVVLI